ncbi:hypothetical protein [Tannerella forsythia]|uniref:hypothetical protein n=2 Tax=Tannerella forsythia TaxID=28112 RepID=UPI0028E1D522|nr:hypothetical protein [Tannerella forsythia]
MAKNNRKQALFNKFSNQLRLLKDNGLISFELKYSKTYICPLCLNQFSETDLDCSKSENCLTEEDAPPASLGGSRIALTCKKCNSECGHKIDFHLNEFIQEEEKSEFVPGSIQKGTIFFNGCPITTQRISLGNGEFKLAHSEKQNNPKIFQKYIKSFKANKPIKFEPTRNRVNINKVNYALLKTNYIITFSKFGYIFLLDNRYDKIREQILNPDKEIIKYNLVATHNTYLKDHIGTHYVLDMEIRSILNIFNLETKLTKKAFGVFLPIPAITIDQFVSEMEKRNCINKSKYDPSINLFDNLNEIKKIREWTNGET